MNESGAQVEVDLSRVRENGAELARRVKAEIWATIKADAYGLGAAEVAKALGPVVAGFCVFSLEEAVSIGLWKLTGKPAISMGPPLVMDAEVWEGAHVRPAVTTVEEAFSLRGARPLLNVDTGMQRFSCPAEEMDAVMLAGNVDEVFTHAVRMEQVGRFAELTAKYAGGTKRMVRHAAASALIDEPSAWFDKVRPGFGLYRGALRVVARIVEVHRSRGEIGYTGWRSETGFHGVIMAGYSHGLRSGPVMINGRRQRIGEAGMQTAYVTLDENDLVGDEAVLLGDGLSEADLAFAQESTPYEVMGRMARLGRRRYVRVEK